MSWYTINFAKIKYLKLLNLPLKLLIQWSICLDTTLGSTGRNNRACTLFEWMLEKVLLSPPYAQNCVGASLSYNHASINWSGYWDYWQLQEIQE
jgi:hypothetical protein